MKHRVTLAFLAFFLVLLLVSLGTAADNGRPEDGALRDAVMALDRQLFDDGFNRCRLERFEELTAADLEFFHDKGGRQDRAAFLKATRNNLCGNPDARPVRTLVPGSTQVFALENNGVLYGAIQQGVHRFHLRGQDPARHGYTEARFSHVWILVDGRWQLKTALSYDHRAVNPAQARAQTSPRAQTLLGLELAGLRLRLETLPNP